MELLNLDKSHFIMAFNDQEAMARMAEKCKSASLQVVYANSRKKLAQADAITWTEVPQNAPTAGSTASSMASALSLLNRMNNNKEDYYVLVIRKNYWA